ALLQLQAFGVVINRLRARFVLPVALALTALCASDAAAQASSGLQRLLDAELGAFPARAGIWVKHLTTGEEASVRADETFNSASVIKLAVLTLAYQMVEK